VLHARRLLQVLDEADQLLEMGFRPAIEKILGEEWGGACACTLAGLL